MHHYFFALFMFLWTYQVIADDLICSIGGNDWPTMPSERPEGPVYFILAMSAQTGKLQRADEDAKQFLDTLKDYLKQGAMGNPQEIYTCLLQGVTRSNLESALERLAASKKLVREQDKVFIYFSGHGERVKGDNIDSRNEFDCVDEALVLVYRGKKKDEWIRDDTFVRYVEQIATQNVYTFLDTCFASGLVRADSLCKIPSKILEPEPLIPSSRCKDKVTDFRQLKGTLYAASGEHEDAYEIAEGGLFTHIFLKSMRKMGTTATLDQIFKETQKQIKDVPSVKGCPPQTPQRFFNE